MSVDATIATWKLSKKQVTPIQKLILLSYADRVGESFECWPSNSRLELDTGLDRHTICENKQKLLEKGLIVYTGEKRGRTKSIDVIRLTYVKGREHSHPDANKPSSVKKPTAQKSSSAGMPIPKQCGNAHTESLSIEPLITTTTCSSSFTPFENKCLEFKHSTDERTPDEFLENVHHHVKLNSDPEASEYQRQQMLLKLLRNLHQNAAIFRSKGFVSKETIKETEKQTQEQKDKLLWSAYQGYVNSPIEKDLRARGIAKLEEFEEWKLKQCTK